MKQFISRVKNLSQKAAEIKAAMQQVPPKMAEFRETIAATTGQLQQLKSEIQYSVADLKADNEDRLSEALQEINGSAEVFRKAGFLVTGVDIEVSPVQRMLVHLMRLEDVHPAMLRSLASSNQQRRTTHAILTSLLQAKQMADTVKLDNLTFSEVAVSVGPVPSVRICWEAETEVTTGHAHPPHLPAVPPIPMSSTVATPTPAAAPQSYFGQSSFFEKRPVTPPAAPVAESAQQVAQIVLPTATASKASTHSAEAAAETKHDPLARFKRMPKI